MHELKASNVPNQPILMVVLWNPINFRTHFLFPVDWLCGKMDQNTMNSRMKVSTWLHDSYQTIEGIKLNDPELVYWIGITLQKADIDYT